MNDTIRADAAPARPGTLGIPAPKLPTNIGRVPSPREWRQLNATELERVDALLKTFADWLPAHNTQGNWIDYEFQLRDKLGLMQGEIQVHGLGPASIEVRSLRR